MNAALAESATAVTVTTPDGIVIRRDFLIRSLAKLSASGEHLPADATDHAIVFDVASGLMEAVNAPGFDKEMEHDAAVAAAKQLEYAGYSDWALPTIPEAIHAVDYSRYGPAVDIGLYPDASEGGCWWTQQQTAWTLDETGSSRSFFFVLMGGGLVGYDGANLRLRARPVRRAAPASQCLVIGQ